MVTLESWKVTQQKCPDLRWLHAHLTQGTRRRRQKKVNKIPDVKKYLLAISIARDGMLNVCTDLPFQPVRERIVVPREVPHGVLTELSTFIFTTHLCTSKSKLYPDISMHLTLTRPWRLSSLTFITAIPLKKYTCSFSQAKLGWYAYITWFHIRSWCTQTRKTVYLSFTWNSFFSHPIMPLTSEKSQDLKDGLIALSAEVRPVGDRAMMIRVDPTQDLST